MKNVEDKVMDLRVHGKPDGKGFILADDSIHKLYVCTRKEMLLPSVWFRFTVYAQTIMYVGMY